MTENKEPRTAIDVTDREAQMLIDAIHFIWKSGAVQSRDGAGELIALEERIEAAIIKVKDKKHG